MIRLKFAALLVPLLAVAPLRADVKPHALMSDGMVLQQDKPIHVFGTAAPGEEVAVTLTRKAQKAAGKVKAGDDGHFLVKLPAMKADGNTPATIEIAGKNTVTIKDVLLGEVWVCSGQSNMEFKLASDAEAKEALPEAKYPEIRLFTVGRTIQATPQFDCGGKWEACTPETAARFSAVGYWFGRDLFKDLKVPVGLIHSSWGGTPAEAWTSAEGLTAEETVKYYAEQAAKALESFSPEKTKSDYETAVAKWKEATAKAKADGKPEPKKPQAAKSPLGNSHLPTGLYNGMIAPLTNYPVKGATWYQGESNAGRAYEYRKLITAMISDWRKQWKDADDFTFLIVHLAPFQAIDKEPGNSTWAELRDAQHNATLVLPKVGEAVITDVGDAKDIHPRRKRQAGERLAVAARAIAYGEKIVYQGPIPEKVDYQGAKAIVSYKPGSELVVKGDGVTGFAIAGADGKYHWADALVEGQKIILTSKDVPEPKSVRFGWSNNPVVNLWNAAGLPAVPFRTDDQKMSTMPKK